VKTTFFGEILGKKQEIPPCLGAEVQAIYFWINSG
jgi:hypothetical protein